jgi:glycine cleavage system regulatory protein
MPKRRYVIDSEVARVRSELAAVIRHDGDPERVAKIRAHLSELTFGDRIRRAIEAAPALPRWQVEELVDLLKGKEKRR